MKTPRTEVDHRAVVPVPISDAAEHAAGLELARVFQLRRSRTHADRFDTTHGNKTAVGLARTAAAILSGFAKP